MTQVQLTRTIAAPASQVYQAFTNSTSIREWLSDFGTTDPRKGGRIYLWWNSGYYTAGEYLDLVPNERVEFSWLGRGEPGSTQVRVDLREMDGKTALTLTHSGLGESPEWEQERLKFEKEWERSLRFLVTSQETGEDLRITRRPMLGVTLGDYNQDIARKMNVPVSEGVLLDGLIEGMGAQKAGLQKDDVIVALDGMDVTSFPTLVNLVQKHEAGDQLEVTFYRGPEKKTVTMTLSARPMPEIPWNTDELANRMGQLFETPMRELASVFEGCTDEEASRKPATDEWSAKEILAHLIHDARDYNLFVSQVINRDEPQFDGFGSNIHARSDATAKVYGTVQGLLDELHCAISENVEFLRNLPEEFVQNKPAYWRVAYFALQDPIHITDHQNQISLALEAARSGS